MGASSLCGMTASAPGIINYHHINPAVRMRRGRLTSMVKSTCPGVSMMLMSVSFHLQKVAADWIVIPFSRSRSIESILAPTPSLPRTYDACLGFGAQASSSFQRAPGFHQLRCAHVALAANSQEPALRV